MRRALIYLLALPLAAPAFAAVNGTVVNRTTGQPQPGAIVSLVQPGQGGMQTLESKKSDAQGAFAFSKEAPPGPVLVQAFYGAVIYTKAIPPGSPSSGIQVDVYDSSSKPGTAKLTQRFIILQPSASALGVSESFLFQGDPKLAFNDNKNGTLRFYFPPEAKGPPKVAILAPGGMPITREAEKTKDANVYKLDYPIKPGETRFDVTYSLPLATPLVFEGKNVMDAKVTDLVAPPGVTLKGEDIQDVGKEPKTQATVYRVKGSRYKVEVEGMGSLAPATAGAAATEPGEDSGAPQGQAVNPRIYDSMYWILGLAFAVLALGSVRLYRSAVTRK